MRRELNALGIVLGLSLTACTRDLCGRHSDCSDGQVCSTLGLCSVPDDAPGDSSGDAKVPDTHLPPDAPFTESP